jgi:hypothetical protein
VSRAIHLPVIFFAPFLFEKVLKEGEAERTLECSEKQKLEHEKFFIADRFLFFPSCTGFTTSAKVEQPHRRPFYWV